MVKVAKKAKSRKPSRKDIKQPDQFIEATTKSAELLSTYRNPLILFVVAIFLVSLGLFGFNYYRKNQEAASSDQLTKALEHYKAEVKKDAKKDDKKDDKTKVYATSKEKYTVALKHLKKVADTYPNTRAGSFARLYMANCHFHLKQYAKAQPLYMAFLRKTSPSDPLYYVGANGLAYTLDALKKPKEGLKLLEEASNKGAPSSKAFALLRLAEYHHHRKDYKKARGYYKKLAKDKSPYQAEAKKRLAILP